LASSALAVAALSADDGLSLGFDSAGAAASCFASGCASSFGSSLVVAGDGFVAGSNTGIAAGAGDSEPAGCGVIDCGAGEAGGDSVVGFDGSAAPTIFHTTGYRTVLKPMEPVTSANPSTAAAVFGIVSPALHLPVVYNTRKPPKGLAPAGPKSGMLSRSPDTATRASIQTRAPAVQARVCTLESTLAQTLRG
jgi:hypothetical protein